MGFLSQFTAKFAPQEVFEDPELAFRARVIVAFSFAVSTWGPIYAAVLFALAHSWAAVITLLVATVIIGGTPFLMKFGVPIRYLSHWITLNTFLIVNAVAWLGFGSESLWWQSTVVVVAVLLCSVRAGLFWLAVSIIHLVIFYGMADSGGPWVTRAFSGETQLFWQASVMAGLYVVIGLLILGYESLKNWALERVRARQALTEAILSAAPDGIITLRADGLIEGANAAAAALFGYERASQLHGLMLEALVPSICQQVEDNEGDEASNCAGEQVYERMGDRDIAGGVRRDQSEFPIDISVREIEKSERYVAVLRDITELDQAQKTLKSARDSALKANQAKSTFLANMSHELRTPLNAIIGYSELLGEDAEDMGQNAMVSDLRKIRVAGKHLLTLINDILDISKIEAGQTELYIERLSLRDLLDEIMLTVQSPGAKDADHFILDFDRAPAYLQADATKLRQILLNLLSNAIKFSDHGPVQLRVFTESRQNIHYCVFEVEDQGIGIEAEKLDTLFELFEQADASTTRLYGGTGLGLAISKSFVEMMGGTISVDSEIGEGTTFRVELPIQAVVQAQGAQELQEADAAPETIDIEAVESAERVEGVPNILVIDDDPVVHQLMGKFLGREGFKVHSATGGAMGLQMARKVRPDVIALDVMMSKMDGWSVLNRLKSDPQLAEIPVVMVSIVNDKNMGYSLGADDYLVKPVERRRLVEVLGRYVDDAGEKPILLVEDDTLASEMMIRSIEREGWEVHWAADGVEALALLDGGLRPGLLLLDIMMPNMDGFEMLSRLKANPEWAQIPVVVVSAAVLSAEEREKLNAHVEKILQKGDHSPGELLDQVRRVLQRS